MSLISSLFVSSVMSSPPLGPSPRVPAAARPWMASQSQAVVRPEVELLFLLCVSVQVASLPDGSGITTSRL